MAAIRRYTDILGGIVGGLPPLVPFAGWRVYDVTDVYTDPEGIEFPVFRLQKTAGPTTDTISQVQSRTASFYVEKTWPMGGGDFSGQFPGLAWYLLDPSTMAAVAGPLLPLGNTADLTPFPAANAILGQKIRDVMPLTNHFIQWFEHSTPTGPFIAVLVAREPSEDFPLFIGGHPVDIAVELLERKGETVDAVTAAAVRAALGPELGHIAPIVDTDERPQDTVDLFSEAYGFATRLGESGKTEFALWREKISTLPTTVLDRNSIRAEGGSTFDLADSTRITQVRVTAQVLSPWQQGTKSVIDKEKSRFRKRKIRLKTVLVPTNDKPASGLLINSPEITFDYSTDGTTPDSDSYGEQSIDIELGGMPAFIGLGGGLYQANLEQFAEGIARKVFDGHARGRQMLTAVAIRGKPAAGLQLGDTATVDFDHLPNAQLLQTPTSQRGGLRPFRVVERTEQMPGPVLTLADEGTGVQFATTPALVVWTDPVEPDLLLVSVSDAATLAAAGAQVEFQVRVFAAGDPIDLTDPGASYTVKDSTLWTDDPQVLRLGPFPLAHTVLLRVRAWLYGGSASDWSPWTGLGGEVTGPQTTLSDLVINSTTDEGAVISWSYDESPPVGDVLVQYRLHGGGGYTLFSTLAPGTETETIDGLTADTWYDVRVVLDNGGEYGDVLLGSFQTLVGSISGLTVGTPTSDGAALSWTNSHPTAAVRVRYRVTGDPTYSLYQLLPAGSVQLTLTGLTAATGYDVEVQLVDSGTGTEVGAALTDSFTTAGAGSMVTLTTPTSAQVFGGWDAFLSVASPGSYGLQVIAVFGPPHMEIAFEEAVETAAGSGTPGTYTEVARLPAVVSGFTTFQANAPNDGKLRYLKARAVASGSTSSAYTGALSVDPWPATPIVPDPPSLTIGGMVPTHILSTESFTVPVRRQALFTVPIDNEGILLVDGVLEAVD